MDLEQADNDDCLGAPISASSFNEGTQYRQPHISLRRLAAEVESSELSGTLSGRGKSHASVLPAVDNRHERIFDNTEAAKAQHLLTLSEAQIRDLDKEIKKCYTENGHRRIIYENSCHIWAKVEISEAEKQKRKLKDLEKKSNMEENTNKRKKYPDFTVSQLRTKNKRVAVHAISYFCDFAKLHSGLQR